MPDDLCGPVKLCHGESSITDVAYHAHLMQNWSRDN